MRAERLIAELQEQIEQRRFLFQQHSVTTISQYHEKKQRIGTLPATPPAILVMIDNIAEFVSQNEGVLDVLKVLMREGRSFGIFFVVTAYSLRNIGSLLATFETRLALRLNSDDDSTQLIGKDYASKLIQPDQPGRGFLRSTRRPLEVQIALPVLVEADMDDGATYDDTAVAYSDINGLLAASAEVVRSTWQLECRDNTSGLPQPLRLLPTAVTLHPLLDALPATAHGWTVPLGIDGSTFQLACWALQQTAHILITGSRGSGKGTLLRTLLATLTAQARKDRDSDIEFVLVDYGLRTLQPFAQAAYARRFLDLPVGKERYDVAVISDKEELTAAFQVLSGELAERNRALRRGEPLRRRTILVINNWELTSPGEVAAALVSLEPYARRGTDVGFHCVITNPADFGVTGLIKSIRTNCMEIIMGRPLEGTSQALAINRRFKAVLSGEMTPGRGFLLETGKPLTVVQFAYTAQPA